MAQTLLQLIQGTAVHIGLAKPDEAFSASDNQTMQLVHLLHDVGDELMTRHDWQALKVVQTFTGAATQALQDDHDRFAGSAELWDTSLDSPCKGPLDTLAWDSVNVRESNSAQPYWALIGNQINLYPTPSASITYRYQYISNKWINDVSAGSMVADWTADTDTCIFNDRLMRFGLRYRWKQEKGLSYAEEMEDFERLLEMQISRDRGPRTVSTSPQFEQIPDNWYPGVIT